MMNKAQEIALGAIEHLQPRLRLGQLMSAGLYQILQVVRVQFQLSLQTVDLEMSLYARLHLVHLERLCYIVDATALESLHSVAGVAKGAEEDNRNRGESLIRLQQVAHLETAHLRHVDVEQDQVGRVADGCFERQASAWK